jgi:PAS domain S-box-containing protein
MRMLGYEEAELLPHLESWTQSIHPNEQQNVLRTLQDYLQGHIPSFVIEMRMRCKDGSYKWILCRGTIVSRDEHGQALRMIGIQSDISDRKMAEQALIQAREEADRANRAKSDFLSSMSHELRTPMNAILGFGQLMEYDESLQEEQLDNVNEILKAGKHLLGLINEVLDLAKVESGHIDLSLEPVEICPVVEECLSLIQTQANKRGIQISHSGLAGMAVRADRTRLKQVLLNLLSNAVKYNHEGGSIRLSLEPREEEYLRIRVTDTGPGIAEEYLETLFQPFNRLDAENSEIEGTGIGLTITRRIVEMMGGSIGVESTLGQGSSFWIDLPMDTDSIFENEQGRPENPAASNIKEVKPHKEQTILYIEDNPSNIKLVAQLFSRRPHIHLITAHLPELGIELALKRKPRIILLDINMPGMDGYEVLQVIKRDPELKDTPVIAITANAMPSDITRGKAAGFDAYLTKPLNIQEFYQVVDKYLMD